MAFVLLFLTSMFGFHGNEDIQTPNLYLTLFSYRQTAIPPVESKIWNSSSQAEETITVIPPLEVRWGFNAIGFVVFVVTIGTLYLLFPKIQKYLCIPFSILRILLALYYLLICLPNFFGFPIILFLMGFRFVSGG